MRWIKHLTAAHIDQNIQDLLAEFGAEGYGVYWIILELLGSQLDAENNDPVYRLTYKKWAETCTISVQKFKKISKFFSELGMFFIETDEKFATVRCPKMVKYRDEYTKKKERNSG